MKSVYASPLRVYLCLGMLALAGIIAGLKLPISLFPNSSKPTIEVSVPYGGMTPEDFLSMYGRDLESELRRIQTDQVQVEQVRASYEGRRAQYDVEFHWGAPARAAQKEVETSLNSFSSRFPEEIRNGGLNVWSSARNSGFIFISFYSPKRSLDELYALLEPLIAPQLAKVPDAMYPVFFNPNEKEIRVELVPEKMAAFGLFPRDVEKPIRDAMRSYGGGSITVGTDTLSVQMPRLIGGPDVVAQLARVPVPTASKHLVHLADIAHIDLATKTEGRQVFKTGGNPSLIIFSKPRPDGNIKQMAEDIAGIVRKTVGGLPPEYRDIEYKVLIDPSEFIRSAVENVLHEVAIGALLAVAILFVFIGSLRNVITAAIEIPLSMVMAFILMRLSGMNLNLISLGGLALSAGMNVDGSVVVMENIFRHFDHEKGPLDFAGRLRVITEAVNEVKLPVIASTIASLVVFLPLAFTSELSYAILGDLAKTVVFSHGLSAFVALILVPTVRLQLMNAEAAHTGGQHVPVHSPVERHIRALEDFYGRTLRRFLDCRRARRATYGGLALALVLLVALVLPRLPKEIVGLPDTEYLILGINTSGNTTMRQFEAQVDEVEAQVAAEFGSEFAYTFTELGHENGGNLFIRLRSKRDMESVWRRLEARFTNTPTMRYWVAPFNPSELPIPDPPQLKVVVRGGELTERAEVAEGIFRLMQEKQIFPRNWDEPNVTRTQEVRITPRLELWPALRASGATFLPDDLADLARVATLGRTVGTLRQDGHGNDIVLSYPRGRVATVEDLAALPVGVKSKLVPLKALADIRQSVATPLIYREDEREIFTILGKQNRGDNRFEAAALEKGARTEVDKWLGERDARLARENAAAPAGGAGAKPATTVVRPTVTFEDAQKELNGALRQLTLAIGLSALLIFLTLLVQFGDVVNSLLVLVAIPLGLIGVLTSLFVFRSTLSLNSALGVILLNGIAVANSIILVDFIRRLVDSGMTPVEAAVEAGRKRLRPILITSLTTILGMLPVALGLGDGGKILQPLGIAVSGGLWVSMGFTLLVVPALQVAYLERRFARAQANGRVFVPSTGVAVAGDWVEDEGSDSSHGRVSAPRSSSADSHPEVLQ